MLQQTAPAPADDTSPQQDALDAIARQRDSRKKTRERLRNGLPDHVIDELDLRATENMASADGAFAAALERAIEAGLERDLPEKIDDIENGLAVTMIVPRVRLPEQVPASPAPLTGIAEALAGYRQAQVDEDVAATEAEKAEGRTIVRNTLTVLDLRAGLCKFSASESSPYFFCGAPTGSDTKAWCPRHQHICYPLS